MESENNSRPYRRTKAELRSSLRCSRISETMRKRIPNKYPTRYSFFAPSSGLFLIKFLSEKFIKNINKSRKTTPFKKNLNCAVIKYGLNNL